SAERVVFREEKLGRLIERSSLDERAGPLAGREQTLDVFAKRRVAFQVQIRTAALGLDVESRFEYPIDLLPAFPVHRWLIGCDRSRSTRMPLRVAIHA